MEKELIKILAQLADEVEVRKGTENNAYELRRHMANFFERVMSMHLLDKTD